MELFRPQTNQLVLKGPVTRDGHQHVDEGRHVCVNSVYSLPSVEEKIHNKQNRTLYLIRLQKLKLFFRVFQSSEDKGKAREDRQTRATRGKNNTCYAG